MIPPKSHPKWRQLVTGEIEHTFKVLPCAMCVARLVRFVKLEAADPGAIDMAVDDLHAFFSRLDHALADDLKAIFGPEDDHA